ncbi:hypothetical protein RZS08_16490, partial [Arthrospira platensis SPKY1]|nr:hypothetical protein [Arthrospira platensis SPKY1]
MKNSILIPIGFALLVIGLIYGGIRLNKAYPDDQGAQTYQAQQAQQQVSEQQEASRLIIRPRTVYVSYHIIRNFGVQKATGA